MLTLTALVVGSMIGSGIFSIPQQMSENAGAGAIIIAWTITFFGMLMISWVFQNLSMKRPDILDSFYGYARQGFGDYIGLQAAWGHWVSTCLGNAGYLIIIFSALSSFAIFDFFGDGTTTPALFAEIILLFLIHLLVTRGVKIAAFVNTIVTIAKIVPIILFIITVVLFFKVDIAKIDFWGSPASGSIIKQVESTMLYTVWEFIGIESASVYTKRAKSMKDVSRATLFGFLITFALLVLVSVLSLGIVPHAELAVMKNPSMAGVIAHALGSEVAMVINIGLIVSVLGSLLVWIMLSAEYLSLASEGEENTVPSFFGTHNRFGSPIQALRLSSGIVFVLLIIAHFNSAGYNKMVMLSTSMALIPYILTAGFAYKLVSRGAWSPTEPAKRWDRFFTLVAMIYGAWLVYAAGIKYLLIGTILYAPAILFYIKAKKEKHKPYFDKIVDKVVASIVVIAAMISIYLIFHGELVI
ncbi:arginine-ornithine antiporter [Brenneria alni]|uniref:Arginine-ornithine antiporter n=2 Tax=Brenneria alni TaxID=71656 RepID=A0A421DTL6_9GAMM|nr:arginine-ornithine antiporter [Brenneria alni]